MASNKALKILFTCNGIFVLAGSLLGPLYAVYVNRIDKSIMSVSFSWAAFIASTSLFSLFIAKYGDGVKKKERMLMLGYLIRAVVWFLYIFTRDLPTLFALQFLLGLGEALGTPTFDALFAEHLDKNKHIAEYSDWKIVSNLVLVFGTIMGGFMVTNFGFTSVFLLMSLLAFESFFGFSYYFRFKRRAS